MSASSKKKLRRENEAAKMTERQLAEQKEAKKLKIYTGLFIGVLVMIIAVAAIFATSQLISTSGILQKNTAAASIGDTELSNAELNYYFVDSVNEFYSNCGTYAILFGLDVSTPLNEQISDEESGTTWADDFLSSAMEKAKDIYALANEAKKNGYALSEDDQADVDADLMNIETYAVLYGFSDADSYLKAIYGNGASMESYREYYELNTLASAYYSAYSTGLKYDDDAIRAEDKENGKEYSIYTYNSYYLSASKFLTGGTTDENGTTTYSDEEKADSVKAAEKAANSLIVEEIATVEDLDAAIAALEINAEAETPASSTLTEDASYSSINSAYAEWVSDPSRKAGDVTVVANETTTTEEDGTETTTINGYYVVMFNSVEDNNYPLVNVRHILVSFEGGTTDSSTGVTTYSDDEKAAAKAEAEAIYEQWKSEDATEDTFAILANELSTDTGSNTNGGLYEDIIPGQMVTAFNDWCFDTSRKAGDTGIVETEYGYHIMFFVGESETIYRDLMIENALRTADTEEWYHALVEAVEVKELDTKYISKDLVISAS